MRFPRHIVFFCRLCCDFSFSTERIETRSLDDTTSFFPPGFLAIVKNRNVGLCAFLRPALLLAVPSVGVGALCGALWIFGGAFEHHVRSVTVRIPFRSVLFDDQPLEWVVGFPLKPRLPLVTATLAHDGTESFVFIRNASLHHRIQVDPAIRHQVEVLVVMSPETFFAGTR